MVGDLNNCPRGYHYDVYAQIEDGTVYLWTSDLLGVDDFTVDASPDHYCLSDDMIYLRMKAEHSLRPVPSTTALVREAIEMMLQSDYGKSRSRNRRRGHI